MQESTDMAVCLPCLCRMHMGHGVHLGHSCTRAFFFIIIRHCWDMARTQTGHGEEGKKKTEVKTLTWIFLISWSLSFSQSHTLTLISSCFSSSSSTHANLTSLSLFFPASLCRCCFFVYFIASVSSFLCYLSLTHFLCFVCHASYPLSQHVTDNLLNNLKGCVQSLNIFKAQKKLPKH